MRALGEYRHTIGIVGPLPPPAGGMANQCRQLMELLTAEGAKCVVVRTNTPYTPAWISGIRWIREPFRLIPYVVDLWRAAAKVDVFHLFANSGWSWHLVAMPAILIARLRGVALIVNYRGGGAEAFLAKAPRIVHRAISAASLLVVPSAYLAGVFSKLGFEPQIVPNIIDLQRFHPSTAVRDTQAPRLLVTRNLERIYDIGTAIRALALVRSRHAEATLTIAGKGPELQSLRALARELGVEGAVDFRGAVDNRDIGILYREADVFINPSLVDNMPISVLEAFASGVPVVSTNVGGVPFVAEDGVTALLVPPSDPPSLARAILEVLDDAPRAAALTAAALENVRRYGWDRVREQWFEAYRQAIAAGVGKGGRTGSGQRDQTRSDSGVRRPRNSR